MGAMRPSPDHFGHLLLVQLASCAESESPPHPIVSCVPLQRRFGVHSVVVVSVDVISR